MQPLVGYHLMEKILGVMFNEIHPHFKLPSFEARFKRSIVSVPVI